MVALHPHDGRDGAHTHQCLLESVASYLCHFMLTCDLPMTHHRDRTGRYGPAFRC